MITLDIYETLVISCIVLLVGRFMVANIGFLNRYTIPSAVAGGLLAALVFLLAKVFFNLQINFDMSIKDTLMLAFFASIGLNANIAELRAGGKMISVFLVSVVGLLFIQNAVGIALSKILNINPLLGLVAGSITLSGGHGTGAAWGPIFVSKYGFKDAVEAAMACATFGLVLGGMIGGPIAQYLIKRHKLEHVNNTIEEDNPIDTTAFEQPEAKRSINSWAILETIAMLSVCLTVGRYIEVISQNTVFAMPSFVWVLFVGVVLRNILSYLSNYQIVERSVSILGNTSLSLFLAMSLMSLKLWDLASLALPILIILIIQTLIMALYAIFVTFRIMGKTYDAAVLAAGHCGFGLGATPTAIANMQSVCEKFGPSHISFIVVPMVGAFFIDLANAIIIKLFLLLPFFKAII